MEIPRWRGNRREWRINKWADDRNCNSLEGRRASAASTGVDYWQQVEVGKVAKLRRDTLGEGDGTSREISIPVTHETNRIRHYSEAPDEANWSFIVTGL